MPLTSKAQTQVFYDANLTIQELSEAYSRWERAHNQPHLPTIFVPLLDIYNPEGKLIYHGDERDTAKAAQILNSLPNIPLAPPSSGVMLGINDVLEITPAATKWKSAILNKHHFVVVSYSIRGSGKISNDNSAQNHAVDSIPRRRGVDIDIVRLNIVLPKN